MSCTETFYVALPVLHAAGAFLALGLSFGCDTGQAVQTARSPYSLPVPPGISDTKSFMAAYPWDEGGEFQTHTWNPFALIFVFEWLTAGFALRPLQYWMDDKSWLLRIWIAWLVTGQAVFLAWIFNNSGGICPAMLATVSASFIMSGVVALYSLRNWSSDENKYYSMTRLTDEEYRDREGSTWKVPPSVCMLRKRKTVGTGGDGEDQESAAEQRQKIVLYENQTGVLLRYAEYCITAPLLFLAVVCLMVQEAPAWLFLTGYWLLITCNAIGIALHVSFIYPTSKSKEEDGGIAPFILRLFFAGPW